MSKFYLDKGFNPTTPERAALIKVIADNGRVTFYRPEQRATQKAIFNAWELIGEGLGVDFTKIPLAEWLAGCKHEAQEHAQTVNGDAETIARIAWDHLKEEPQYYTELQTIEAE